MALVFAMLPIFFNNRFAKLNEQSDNWIVSAIQNVFRWIGISGESKQNENFVSESDLIWTEILPRKVFFVCLPQFESNNFNGKAEKRKFLSGWLSSRISFPFRSNFSKLYFDFFLGAWLLTQLLISRVSLSRLVYIHAFAGPYSIKIFSVSIYNALELKGSDWWLQVTWPFSEWVNFSLK